MICPSKIKIQVEVISCCMFSETPCIHHFMSELIYNMDHMRISGTEPSSVILRQTK